MDRLHSVMVGREPGPSDMKNRLYLCWDKNRLAFACSSPKLSSENRSNSYLLCLVCALGVTQTHVLCVLFLERAYWSPSPPLPLPTLRTSQGLCPAGWPYRLDYSSFTVRVKIESWESSNFIQQPIQTSLKK